MDERPAGREELYDFLVAKQAQLASSLCSIFVLVRGNPGTGKTYTVRRALPAAQYVNCKLEGDLGRRYASRAIIFDEADCWLRSNGLQATQLFQRFQLQRTKRLVVLVCNDLSNASLAALRQFNIATFDVEDYSEEQLLRIARQVARVQEISNPTSVRLIVKRVLEAGRGDYRGLMNKVLQLGDAGDVPVRDAAQIDALGDAALSYGEAYCLRALQELAARGARTAPMPRSLRPAYRVGDLLDQLDRLGFEYDDQAYVQQHLEHLQTKGLVELGGGLVAPREAAASPKMRRTLDGMLQ